MSLRKLLLERKLDCILEYNLIYLSLVFKDEFKNYVDELRMFEPITWCDFIARVADKISSIRSVRFLRDITHMPFTNRLTKEELPKLKTIVATIPTWAQAQRDDFTKLIEVAYETFEKIEEQRKKLDERRLI